MRISTLTLALVAAALTACGGGSVNSDEQSCTVARAAFIAPTDDSADDIALTGPEHAGLTDAELVDVGRIHARIQGLDASALIVGNFAFCAE